MKLPATRTADGDGRPFAAIHPPHTLGEIGRAAAAFGGVAVLLDSSASMPALLDLLKGAQAVGAVGVLALLLLAETLHPFFDALRGRHRAVHAARNLALGAVNGALVAFVFAGVWGVAAGWAEARGVGLLALAPLPTWLHAVLAILLLDAWTYAWHRLNHRLPVLWRLHRVHHADAAMDVTTAHRFHIGEIVLSSLLRVPLIVVLGAHLWELVLYETLMFAVVQFHHADVALPPRLDRALRAAVVTPALHKVHHSRERTDTDSNYSALFSWWDRLFGSFRTRADLAAIRLGLDEFDRPGDDTVAGMVRMPFAPLHPSGDAAGDGLGDGSGR